MKVSGTSKGQLFTISGFSGGLNPVDATTYYTGLGRGFVPTTTETDQDFNVGFNCRLKAVYLSVLSTGAGTAENSTLNLRNVTQGTSTLIGNFTTNTSTGLQFTFTNLNIQILSTDFITLEWITPTYGTNPTNTSLNVNLIFEI